MNLAESIVTKLGSQIVTLCKTDKDTEEKKGCKKTGNDTPEHKVDIISFALGSSRGNAARRMTLLSDLFFIGFQIEHQHDL